MNVFQKYVFQMNVVQKYVFRMNVVQSGLVILINLAQEQQPFCFNCASVWMYVRKSSW